MKSGKNGSGKYYFLLPNKNSIQVDAQYFCIIARIFISTLSNVNNNNNNNNNNIIIRQHTGSKDDRN